MVNIPQGKENRKRLILFGILTPLSVRLGKNPSFAIVGWRTPSSRAFRRGQIFQLGSCVPRSRVAHHRA